MKIQLSMHKERRERNEVRILSIQCGVGFQTHRIPAAGQICAAFVFHAGNGRWRNTSVMADKNLMKYR